MKFFKSVLAVPVLLLAVTFGAFAAEPNNYYSSCENKSGRALLEALNKLVGPHTTVSYDGLWNVYKTSDVRANGTVWDMYSTKEWVVGQEHCGNYKNVGDCINREHSMPKSWFNNASPMYSDAFHLYPTDGKVNGQRSDFPYGECAKGTTLASNGSVKALGRLGSSTFAGYTGTVFEPDDEYKGDFARTYFYMAAAYMDKIGGWSSPMLAGNPYPAFTSWAIELLLKWHRQDPVSEKERNRNDAVYSWQKNRNPFIDHEELAEYIWGNKQSESWSYSSGAQPTLMLPVNNSTLDLGVVKVGQPFTKTITVKGTSLRTLLNLSLSGGNGNYRISPTSVTANEANSDAGKNVNVTVTATAVGTVTATLTVKAVDNSLSAVVNLTARAVNGIPVMEASNITDESFLARWNYAGGEDANGAYTLYVLDAEGNAIQGYPRSVKADEGEYLVDGLDPETTYIYYLQDASGQTSERIDVTTSAPIPSVQILYDGELDLTAEPGEPSEAFELLLDIENIFSDITFSVASPFQLSSDKSNWSTSLVVDPLEDRIYIRIFGDEAGDYTTEIKVTAANFYGDDAEVSGRISAVTGFIEDFEVNETGNYNTTKYTGSVSTWELSDAGVYNVKTEAYGGNNYLRFGKTSGSYARMTSDKEKGVGTVTVYASGWSAADGSTKFKLQYSTDGGASWQDAGEVEIAKPASSTKEYKPYTFTVNKTGNVRLALVQTYGQRACFDDVTATNYTSGVYDLTFGDDKGTGWDAYCQNGQLVVDLSEPANVAVHGIDGITYVNEKLGAGTTPIKIEKGLYIVVVGKSTRRVLVK